MISLGKRQPPSAADALDSALLRPDFAPNLERPRHRWFPFKEGFSASLVAEIIRHYFAGRSGTKILDPFLGSGTTAVEARRLGIAVDGIEVNPFLALVSRVKTEAYYEADTIAAAARRSRRKKILLAVPRLPRDTTLVQRPTLDKWLFNRSVVRRFEELRAAIRSSCFSPTRELLLLALMAAMLKVANAKRDGKCWRYVSGWRLRRYDAIDLEEAYSVQVEEYLADLEEESKLTAEVGVYEGDARAISQIQGFPRDTIYDGMITSPPYLNSFDYTDIYRPEMLLAGFAQSSTDLRAIRFKTIRSHVQVDWPGAPPLAIPAVQTIVNRLRRRELWHGRIAEMVNAYFVDLSTVIGDLRRRLRKGARAFFVVATSAYGGVVIPVDEILAEIFCRNGFDVEGCLVLRTRLGNGHHQRRSNEPLREVLVIGRAG